MLNSNPDMKHTVVLLSVLFCASGVPPRDRIFGGQDAGHGQFPYIASINDPDPICSGTIISSSWIVTGAVCAELSPEAEIFVGGTINRVNGTSFKINTTVVHEAYDYFTLQNDIGLIRIDGQFEFSDTVQAIEIGPPSAANVPCTLSGWGYTEGSIFPEVLKYVDLKVMDTTACFNLSEDYLYGMYFGPEQMCTYALRGKGACYGDAGGPLVCNGKLAGFHSWTVTFVCAIGFPDIFTKTMAYADWIQTRIQN